MKRLYYIIWLVACALSVQAGVRTMEEAMHIAGQFVAEKKMGMNTIELTRKAMSASVAVEPMQLAYTQMQYDNSQAALYVFNHSEEGFVIVSADDRTRTILGYSDAPFSVEDMPENMRVWMQMYADEIARMSDMVLLPKQAAVEYYPNIEPLLGETEWNQSAPYNDHCPIDPSTNERSVTGCMATATAQVMYHHKYPEHGEGKHSYRWRGNTISMDFSQTVFDWDDMLPQYKKDYTQTQSDAVAELMYAVGVSCNMSYGSSASGAGMGTSMRALVEYFDYDAGIRVLYKDYVDEEQMLDQMAQDLLASHPIQIEALTKKREGHAFVCDGMQSNGYIHINWGWGGHGNGYFALSAMNPTNQGIGGASDDGAFTESVTVYLDIQPDQGGVSVPVMLASKVDMKSAAALAKNQQVTFDVLDFQNGGVGQEQGCVAFLLYQEDSLYKVKDTNFSWDLKPMYYYNVPVGSGANLSDVAMGEYELVIGVHVEGKPVEPLYVQDHGVKRYTLTVTNDSIFMKEIVSKTGPYGTPYETARVTDLSAQTGRNNLRLVLQTLDFQINNKGQVKSGIALSLDLFPESVNSIVGSYAVDANNSQAIGTISSTYSKVMGVENSKQINETVTEGVVSITQVVGGHYVIDYYLKSAKSTFEGRCKLTDIALSSYRQTSTGSVLSYTLTNDVWTAMDAQDAYTWVSQLAHDECTSMPFYVRGAVSQIDAIATEAGDASFYIMGKGAVGNALYCPQAHWLDDTDFVTGSEIAVKDTVMMVGYLQHADLTMPTMHGYVYDYRPNVYDPNTAVEDMTDENVGIRIEGMSVMLSSTHARDTYIYDLMGRVVTMAPAASKQTLTLPMAGCYIVQHGNSLTKIMIE